MNGIDALLDHPAVRALGWALVHFVWQGAIVAALLAGLLAALRKRSAEIRYAAACVALLAMVALPAVTVGVVASHGRRFNDARVRASAAVHFVPAAPARALTPAGEARVATDAPLAQQVVSAPPVRPPAPWAQWAAALCEPWLPWCVVGWAVGVVLLSAPLIGGWRRLQRLTRQGTQPTSEDWQARFVRVAQRLRVSRPVRVLASALTQVPIVIGWLRPVILLPASALTGLTPEQLEAILAHELAHVRRHDYLVNLLQSVIETLLFYHPAVWWVSRRIRVERELCCDDWAVRACGDAFTYARALASLEEQRAIELAPAATGGSLLARIGRILGVPVAQPRLARGWVAGVITLAAVVAMSATFWLTRVRANAAQDQPQYRPIPADAGPTSTVTGLVTDQEDRPVAGAPVFAVARDDEEKSARRAERTNAEGRFRFKNLKPDGYWCFYVDDPRFARECDRERGLPIPTDSADLPLRVRLYPPQSLTGTIVDEAGAAVPDVKVTLVREWLPGAGDNNPVQGWLAFDLQTTTGDREGRFRLERLRPGKIMVMLDHPEYARTLSDILPVEGGEARVTIRKGLTLHGRVLADGKPLPKVQVKVGAPNIAHRSMGQWELATSEAGEFEARHIVSFWEPEGQFVQTVTVQADDPAWRSDWYAVYQLDEQTLPPVEIQAWAREGATREPTMVQVGERRGIAGAPAGGTARVEVRFAGVSKAGQSAVLWNGEENARHVYRRGETGPDGKLVFAGLPAGRYRLGSPNYPGRDIDLSDGQSLQIVMEKAAGSIRGVVRVGGKPLVAGKADVVCYVITGGLHGSYEQFAGSVADDGQYQVDALPFGACALAVYLPRSGSHYYSLTVGTDTTRYDVDLPEGQVTAHLSQPAIDLQNPPHLRAERRDDAAFSDFQSAWLPFDAGGNCTLTNLAPGEYVLIATIPGQTLPRLGAARLDEPTAHVKVELRPPEHSGWIAGALAGLPPPLGASDTASVSMVAVPKGEQGYDPAGCYYGIVNAANGTYRVPDLPMGIYALWLRSSAVDKTIPVFFSSDVEVRGGLIRELDVAIPPGREVLIRLAYEGLQPAREVWRLRFPNGAWLAGGNIVGSHGSNAFTPVLSFRLPFGEYVVEADFGAGPPVARTFAVQPGEGVQEIVVTRP